MKCFECQQSTTAETSRRIWLKERMKEKRLCATCLEKRGASLVPRRDLPLPTRIQLSRRKGWTMPPNTVKVDRSTKWGNPFIVGVDRVKDRAHSVELFHGLCSGLWCVSAGPSKEIQDASRAFIAAHIHELKGMNLACWCPPSAPCHADILLAAAAGRLAPLKTERIG